jgi:hypothetical protein
MVLTIESGIDEVLSGADPTRIIDRAIDELTVDRTKLDKMKQQLKQLYPITTYKHGEEDSADAITLTIRDKDDKTIYTTKVMKQ